MGGVNRFTPGCCCSRCSAWLKRETTWGEFVDGTWVNVFPDDPGTSGPSFPTGARIRLEIEGYDFVDEMSGEGVVGLNEGWIFRQDARGLTGVYYHDLPTTDRGCLQHSSLLDGGLPPLACEWSYERSDSWSDSGSFAMGMRNRYNVNYESASHPGNLTRFAEVSSYLNTVDWVGNHQWLYTHRMAGPIEYVRPVSPGGLGSAACWDARRIGATITGTLQIWRSGPSDTSPTIYVGDLLGFSIAIEPMEGG